MAHEAKKADVQSAVAEKLNPRCAASRILEKEDRAASPAIHTAVGNKCSVATGRLSPEESLPAVCVADRASVVDESTTARRRGVAELYHYRFR